MHTHFYHAPHNTSSRLPLQYESKTVCQAVVLHNRTVIPTIAIQSNLLFLDTNFYQITQGSATIWCNLGYSATQCSRQSNTKQNETIQSYTMQPNTSIAYSAILYNSVRCNAIQHSTISTQYNTVQHRTAQHHATRYKATVHALCSSLTHCTKLLPTCTPPQPTPQF